jgi:hypothetical protein
MEYLDGLERSEGLEQLVVLILLQTDPGILVHVVPRPLRLEKRQSGRWDVPFNLSLSPMVRDLFVIAPPRLPTPRVMMVWRMNRTVHAKGARHDGRGTMLHVWLHPPSSHPSPPPSLFGQSYSGVGCSASVPYAPTPGHHLRPAMSRRTLPCSSVHHPLETRPFRTARPGRIRRSIKGAQSTDRPSSYAFLHSSLDLITTRFMAVCSTILTL